MSLETEYKDYTIRYSEYRGEHWEIVGGVIGLKEEDNRFDKLSDAKKAIDKSLKIKYIPMQVWVKHSGKRFNNDTFMDIKQVEATRPHKNGWREVPEFWININGKRQTMEGESIYLDTPENRRLFPIIASKEAEAEKLREELEKLIGSLEILKELQAID